MLANLINRPKHAEELSSMYELLWTKQNSAKANSQ